MVVSVGIAGGSGLVVFQVLCGLCGNQMLEVCGVGCSGFCSSLMVASAHLTAVSGDLPLLLRKSTLPVMEHKTW